MCTRLGLASRTHADLIKRLPTAVLRDRQLGHHNQPRGSERRVQWLMDETEGSVNGLAGTFATDCAPEQSSWALCRLEMTVAGFVLFLKRAGARVTVAYISQVKIERNRVRFSAAGSHKTIKPRDCASQRANWLSLSSAEAGGPARSGRIYGSPTKSPHFRLVGMPSIRAKSKLDERSHDARWTVVPLWPEGRKQPYSDRPQS